MYNNLEHLSTEDIEELVRRYYNGEAVAQLIEEYHLSVRTSSLYKLFPREVLTNVVCEYCGTNLVRDRPPKNSVKYIFMDQYAYCPSCNHMPNMLGCRCINCIEKEQSEQVFRAQQINEFYSVGIPPVDFDSLSFESKVFCGALFRTLGKENLVEIKPYIEAHTPLAPTKELIDEIYHHLCSTGVIAVSPTSPVDAFVVDETFPRTYHTYRVGYHLNLTFPDNKQSLINTILNPTFYLPEEKDDALKLWRKIAVAECVEYLMYQLKKVRFVFTPGEKTYEVFEVLLNDFSVSQIYGIIWKAVAGASKLYLEKGFNKKHAANSVITGCERIGDRARLYGWNLAEYHRIKELPQSSLSAYFFNRVLGIGDLGFTTPPQII